jgi:hypothetical protein
MEQWERVFWSSPPGFPTSWLNPHTDYVLTDFRLMVRRRGQILHEIALDDIVDVQLELGCCQRLAATSTVRIQARHGHPAMVLRNIRQGPQLALILQLRAAERFGAALDPEFVRSALRSDAAPLLRPNHALIAVAAVLSVLTCVATLVARHSTLAPITYGPDDPIAPGGHRRPTADIVAFMEREVMPFARRALGPVEGGAGKVTCTTCHGLDAASRRWKMPGVRALPEPEVRLAGMERSGFWLDPQVRNAVYGYLADEDKLPTAAYMRGVVMPGMAAVLRRPAYDFTRPYNYNRARVAVGCYHCHLVH